MAPGGFGSVAMCMEVLLSNMEGLGRMVLGFPGATDLAFTALPRTNLPFTCDHFMSVCPTT